MNMMPIVFAVQGIMIHHRGRIVTLEEAIGALEDYAANEGTSVELCDIGGQEGIYLSLEKRADELGLAHHYRTTCPSETYAQAMEEPVAATSDWTSLADQLIGEGGGGFFPLPGGSTPSTPPQQTAPQTESKKKKRALWPWIVGGVVVLGGGAVVTAGAAYLLLRKKPKGRRRRRR